MPSSQPMQDGDCGRMVDWHRSLALIIENDFNDAALQELMNALERLVNAQSSSAIVYPHGQKPFVAKHRLLPEHDPVIHLDRYLEGAYLVDPCYQFVREQRSEGFRTISDVAPEGFGASEYYRIYYHATELVDEAFFALQSVENSAIVVSLGRHSPAPPFVQEEKALLGAVFLLVKTIINKWTLGNHAKRHPRGNTMELDLALANFGTSLLTHREQVIVNLLLRGHSMKSIAAQLNNSVETIKTHRKSIYRKLDVSSQAELFYLFIDALRSYAPASDKDPLAGYMAS